MVSAAKSIYLIRSKSCSYLWASDKPCDQILDTVLSVGFEYFLGIDCGRKGKWELSSECQGDWGCQVQSWAKGIDEDVGGSGGSGTRRWRQTWVWKSSVGPTPAPASVHIKKTRQLGHLERKEGGASRVHWLHHGGAITHFNYKKCNTFAFVNFLQVQRTNVQMEWCFQIIFLSLWLLVSSEVPAHVKVLHLKL